MDDERLKNPDLPFDYFEELTRRVADIRTSEKRFYRKITDIYATSVDYDPTDEKSISFFKTVQNKVHYAITGNTAAEIVVAKNYLTEQELFALNNLVEQYLVFAEGQAMRRVPMMMSDWVEKLHGFLSINDRNILKDAGKISHDLMKEITDKKFDEYKQIEARTVEGGGEDMVDFDKAVLRSVELARRDKKGRK